MITEVFFDLETKKLFEDIQTTDPGDLGVSIVSVYLRELNDQFQEVKGEMQSFWESEFEQLWQIFQKADRVIGFNSTRFDVPALQPYASFPLLKLNHFDLLQEVKNVFGKRLSLNTLTSETLGNTKTDNGLNAVEYWKRGDRESLEKLRKYCEADVDLTKRLYDFGLKNKFLRFKDKWNTSRQIEINFAYPEKQTEAQIGLF